MLTQCLRWALFIFLLAALSSCDTGYQRRPIGWYKLGKAKELQAAETFFDEKLLLLKHDQRGFSVMSTACTYDLSPLILRDAPQGGVFVSRYSESQYDREGKVLKGPAHVDLPYYELSIDAGVAGGPKDTLYVQVGVEKPREWRLPFNE